MAARAHWFDDEDDAEAEGEDAAAPPGDSTEEPSTTELEEGA